MKDLFKKSSKLKPLRSLLQTSGVGQTQGLFERRQLASGALYKVYGVVLEESLCCGRCVDEVEEGPRA